MGFNTVVLLLNDHFTTLQNSPKTVVWALTHPPQHGEDIDQWWKTVHHVADGYQERRLSFSSIKVLPTSHMDDTYLVAVGRNSIRRVGILKTTGGSAIVELPGWWKE